MLIIHDLLGVYDDTPPFAKKYAKLNNIVTDALINFRDDVKSLRFPSGEYTIHMEKKEVEKLEKI